jgi:hypothetical protein
MRRLYSSSSSTAVNLLHKEKEEVGSIHKNTARHSSNEDMKTEELRQGEEDCEEEVTWSTQYLIIPLAKWLRAR